jgi:VanZ family protein
MDDVLRRHPVISLLAAAYGGTMVVLSLTPASDGERVLPLLNRLADLAQGPARADWITVEAADFAVGMLLFVPLGILLVLLVGRRRWLFVIVVGVLASCWIELAQGIWLGDRLSDSRDVVANTVGITLGVVVALVVTWPALHRDRRLAAARPARHAGA